MSKNLKIYIQNEISSMREAQETSSEDEIETLEFAILQLEILLQTKH